MPALPKPHRIAVLVPVVTIDGPDAAYEREASILMWTALVETCQRHPRLSVLDADAMPLFPQDGHFAPLHAGRGARPTDAFFGPTRRDELIWLELSLGKPGMVRLHAIGRDGKPETFDALGRNLGEQVQQVLGAWLTARKLGMLPKPFDEVTSDSVLAVLRVIAPTLAEQARAWTLPVAAAPTWSLAVVRDEPERELDDETDEGANVSETDVLDESPIVEMTIDSTLEAEVPTEGRRSLARPLVARLPQPFRVPALRLLELALREDLATHVLAAEPDHPRGDRVPAAPSTLESVAAIGLAALRRPASLDNLERAANALAESGRIDEAQRLLERAVTLHDEQPRAHLALLDVHRRTGRVGAWLDRALRSAAQHGCPLDPQLPWYPDQIHVDLRTSVALLHAGRLGEAIALRASRLAGRDATWPAQVRLLDAWRTDPQFVATCYAREGYFRGDDARAIEGFSRVEPEDATDLALLLDALVATGRDDEAPLAWVHHGLGRELAAPASRLVAAHALFAAGEWRRGLDELWRVELTEPGRDDDVALARLGLVMAATPIDVIEAALGERIAIGAPTLARRMARDAADFIPTAAKSGLVARALGKQQAIEFDLAWLDAFSPDTRSRRAIDASFAELGPPRKAAPSGFDLSDELQRGDRLVDRWLEVAFTEASEDDRAALAQAAAYTAAQALGRYLAMTTAPPSTIAGALRTVASEALALVRRHRAHLGDRDARALLGALDPLLRRVDRWIGATWLGAVERAVGIDERSGGDVAGFVRDYPVVAARILGPEETAVLSASIARLHRERPDGWAAGVAAQAAWLASHTGFAGADEWADAIAAQLAAREVDAEDAIDALHTACYLAEGRSAVPCVHAARVLLEAGRAPAALAVLCSGLGAAAPAWRDVQLASLAGLDLPIELGALATATVEALQRDDLPRAEKLARWAVALDPASTEAQRNLGLALAREGKVLDAMHHLVRAEPERGAQILAAILAHHGRAPEALAVLEYACRWYARADQWLGYASIAYAAGDAARTAKAYGLAFQLDPDAFDADTLHAYANVLDEVGDHEAAERVAHQLRRAAGDDRAWQTCAWDHLARAYLGMGRFDEAAALAERAVAESPQPEQAARFRVTLERARTRAAPAAATMAMSVAGVEPAPPPPDSWRARRMALRAARLRSAGESHVEVTRRARAAAVATLADTIGTMDREALLTRALALRIREQAYFARDPVPRLGDPQSRDAYHAMLRARGGVVPASEAEAPAAGFVDRVVVPGGKVARASDYIALLRDLAHLAPKDALAQFDLDDSGYLEIARSWAVAMELDPTIAATIEAGLANR
ncbi:MAG TPA: hypothetical protein VGF94_18800 [Kofleriaceae bacterium]|jgi:tetratricopeptide (TPR) repeat protein